MIGVRLLYTCHATSAGTPSSSTVGFFFFFFFSSPRTFSAGSSETSENFSETSSVPSENFSENSDRSGRSEETSPSADATSRSLASRVARSRS